MPIIGPPLRTQDDTPADIGPDIPPAEVYFIPEDTIPLDGKPGGAAVNEAFLDKAGTVWVDWMSRNFYEKDKHIYMMGVTSPSGFQGKSVAFCKLASDTLLMISDWTACKAGEQPVIPDPTSLDPRFVLLDEHYEPVSVTLCTDGVTPLYRISGTFFYGITNPSQLTADDLSFPKAPWLKDVFDRTIPRTSLTTGLMVPTSQGVTLQTGFIPGS